mmetsp:Transcript_5694/g.12409  ORF Transcript_5694/g.12409 Transcript_5694/m.12409 type:complete len:201 (-) Transcript_5694:839-1441(-)
MTRALTSRTRRICLPLRGTQLSRQMRPLLPGQEESTPRPSTTILCMATSILQRRRDRRLTAFWRLGTSGCAETRGTRTITTRPTRGMRKPGNGTARPRGGVSKTPQPYRANTWGITEDGLVDAGWTRSGTRTVITSAWSTKVHCSGRRNLWNWAARLSRRSSTSRAARTPSTTSCLSATTESAASCVRVFVGPPPPRLRK